VSPIGSLPAVYLARGRRHFCRYLVEIVGAAGLMQFFGILSLCLCQFFQQGPNDVLFEASCVVGECGEGHDCAAMHSSQKSTAFMISRAFGRDGALVIVLWVSQEMM
jgi:hypothetical protein